MSAAPAGDFAPSAELERLRAERWDGQRRYVSASSEFFRALWGGHEAPAHLEALGELPLCDKQMLRHSQRVLPPFGDYLAVDPVRIRRVHRTSGTSGEAMNLALSASDAAQTAEIGARAQRAAGLGPGHVVAHCLNYQLWMGGFTDHTTLEGTGATVIPFGVGNSEGLVRLIQELKVSALSCTPSYPAVLERVIAERFDGLAPRDLGLELALFGGEAGLDDPRFRARLEEVWGFAVRNANYGVSDVFCNFAGQCEATPDLHFVGPDVLYSELIDPIRAETRPWREGEQGELVLTHLQREAQPLVRFRTGDIVVLTDLAPCQCGRTAPRFRVVGRSDDMVVVRGINVFPTSVAAVINRLDSLSGEYRIVLEGRGPYHTLPLEVESRGLNASPELARDVAAAIKRNLGVSAEVRVVPPGHLPRTEGKTRRVVRESTA